MNDTLLSSLTLLPEPVVNYYEYRVIYDPSTAECIRKDVVLPTDVTDDRYVVVTEDVYRSIEFCTKFVVKDNQLQRKRVDFANTKKLILTNTQTNLCSIKDDNVFVSTEDTSNVDYWTPRSS